MPRRSYRRRSAETDALIGVAVVIGGAVITAYQRLSTVALGLIIAGVIVGAGLLIGLILFVHFQRLARERQKFRALSLMDLNAMDGLLFEKYVAELLKHRGYTKVTLTERYDLGVDIIAIKDGICWGVQVKRYRDMVKAAAVRQVVTALPHYKCQRAMVVTNSVFSRPAQILARSNDCVLVDRDVLAGWIAAFQH